MPQNAKIDIITTLPNRYKSFLGSAPKKEVSPRLNIKRIKLPAHKSGMIDQAKAFTEYGFKAAKSVRHKEYKLVFATSSRLMTAALGAFIAHRKKLPLYLDIRDIFVDTIKDTLPKKFALIAKPFLSHLEHWVVTRADKVNLVSKGFKPYFQLRYPRQNYSFFSNGIDDEFIIAGNGPEFNIENSEQLTVVYAGNIGEGQGLHIMIPELANRLKGRAHFRIIGDGGRKAQLEKRLADRHCSNVELLPPVKREQLLIEYQNANILFLHLNNYKAFEKVLPSKIFEYAALGKPIWAGVAGYAADFIHKEIDNAAVFYPCDVDQAEQTLDQLNLGFIKRTDFIKKYARKRIMNDMAADILSLIPKEK